MAGEDEINEKKTEADDGEFRVTHPEVEIVFRGGKGLVTCQARDVFRLGLGQAASSGRVSPVQFQFTSACARWVSLRRYLRARPPGSSRCSQRAFGCTLWSADRPRSRRFHATSRCRRENSPIHRRPPCRY